MAETTTAAPDNDPEPTNARQHLRNNEADFAPDILNSLKEAAKTIKTAWGTCTNCNHRVQVEIQDATAAIAASRALLDYTGGKPGTAEGEQVDQVIIQRAVITPALVAEHSTLEGRSSIPAHTPAGDPPA